MTRIKTRRKVVAATLLVLIAVIASCNALGDESVAVPVPPPVIIRGPSSQTTSTSATFHYTDSERGVGFACSLDGSTFVPCAANGVSYRGLSQGQHIFRVRATSGSLTSRAAVFIWDVTAVTRPTTSVPLRPTTTPTTSTSTSTSKTNGPSAVHPTAQIGAGFAISNLAPPPLVPGSSQRLDLVFTNPNSSPVTLASGAVSITVSTSRAGCSAARNFVVTQGLTTSVTIPANQTRSLDGLGIGQSRWPLLTMVDTHASQDACQGAPLTLHYSAAGSG